MKFRYRKTAIFFGILAVALGTAMAVLSHNSACVPAPSLPGDATLMKAIVYRCYGPPEVLALEDIEKPVPADDQVLVRVRAAAVNPLDWHYMRGEPYVMRMGVGVGAPKNTRMGVDFAGTVEAVGKAVTRFKPGDAVFGVRTGAFAQYVLVGEDRNIVTIPEGVTFEQAASIPVAAVTALQALRDKGKVQAGQRVLINGASGGVGTFAVQLAKSFGAEVTAVCSARNAEMVRSIGADHVVDYTTQDFTTAGVQYDLVLDMIGNRALLDVRRAMKPDGTLVIVGGPSDDPWIGALAVPIKAKLLSPFVSQHMLFFISSVTREDLALLADLIHSGKVTPVIDRRFKLAELRDAIAYLETGRARGKVVIDIE